MRSSSATAQVYQRGPTEQGAGSPFGSLGASNADNDLALTRALYEPIRDSMT